MSNLPWTPWHKVVKLCGGRDVHDFVAPFPPFQYHDSGGGSV